VSNLKNAKKRSVSMVRRTAAISLDLSLDRSGLVVLKHKTVSLVNLQTELLFADYCSLATSTLENLNSRITMIKPCGELDSEYLTARNEIYWRTGEYTKYSDTGQEIK
jgi:hypothetical protein